MIDIKVVTILGANGTMGRNIAAIFASFGQAKVYLACRTMEKATKAIKDAYKSVKAESIINNLVPVTYDEIENVIRESDLVLESLTEDIEVKKNMYRRIKPFLKENAIIASGTSGLSIKELAEEFERKSLNFFGIHMFNPPYNLTLCELVLHDAQQEELAKELEKYLSNDLKRVVVRVKDKPAFLGNRIGFFFINEAFKLAYKNMDEGGIDYLDSILGCFTGRNMEPLTTADFVGLDISKAIIDYVYEETNDIFKTSFELPEYINSLINQGKLGKKVNKGLFYKNNDNKLIYVYDIKLNIYRPKNNYQFYFSNEMIKNIRNGKYEEAINILLSDESHEAIICKKMILKYIIYSIYITKKVAYNLNACDDAMATGFSWLPPIAWIDILGGKKEIIKLTKKYLSKKWQNVVEETSFFNNVPSTSKYDYRRFLKAKY